MTATFDGCATWSGRHELLEANYGGRALYEAAERTTSDKLKLVLDKDRTQVERQALVVGRTVPVDWHVSDPAMLGPVRSSIARGVPDATNFSVQHTPSQDHPR